MTKKANLDGWLSQFSNSQAVTSAAIPPTEESTPSIQKVSLAVYLCPLYQVSVERERERERERGTVKAPCPTTQQNNLAMASG